MDADLVRMAIEFGILGIGGYVAKSLNELNVKIAVVIAQLGAHDERLKRLENERN